MVLFNVDMYPNVRRQKDQQREDKYNRDYDKQQVWPEKNIIFLMWPTIWS